LPYRAPLFLEKHVYGKRRSHQHVVDEFDHELGISRQEIGRDRE
jgi:hypothetical protein